MFPDPPLCVTEERDDTGDVDDELAGLKRSVPSQRPSAPPPLPAPLSMFRPTSACGEKMTQLPIIEK